LSVRVKIDDESLNALMDALRNDSRFTEEAIADELLALAFETQAEAKRSIQAHMSGGRRYGRHVASAPGMPPNTDTGRLVASIGVDDVTDEPFGVSVGTNVKYGAYLEFGTGRMKRRPWLARAFAISVGHAMQRIRQRLEK